MNNKIEKFLTQKVVFFETVYNTNKKEEEYLINCINEFVVNNKEIFCKRSIIFGEEKEIILSLIDILSTYIYKIRIPSSILNYEKDKSFFNFSRLLDAFYWDILLQIYANKKNILVKGILHTDLALSFINCASFFENDLELLYLQYLNSLSDFKDKKNKNPKLEKGEFGLCSTVYLSASITKQLNLKKLSSTIESFCKPEIDPTFINIFDNIYKEDYLDKLTKFHLENSKSNDLTKALHQERWQYFPIEMISVLRFARNGNLDLNSTKKNFFIENFSPYLFSKLPIKLEESTLLLKKAILFK